MHTARLPLLFAAAEKACLPFAFQPSRCLRILFTLQALPRVERPRRQACIALVRRFCSDAGPRLTLILLLVCGLLACGLLLLVSMIWWVGLLRLPVVC